MPWFKCIAHCHRRRWWWNRCKPHSNVCLDCYNDRLDQCAEMEMRSLMIGRYE